MQLGMVNNRGADYPEVAISPWKRYLFTNGFTTVLVGELRNVLFGLKKNMFDDVNPPINKDNRPFWSI